MAAESSSRSVVGRAQRAFDSSSVSWVGFIGWSFLSEMKNPARSRVCGIEDVGRKIGLKTTGQRRTKGAIGLVCAALIRVSVRSSSVMRARAATTSSAPMPPVSSLLPRRKGRGRAPRFVAATACGRCRRPASAAPRDAARPRPKAFRHRRRTLPWRGASPASAQFLDPLDQPLRRGRGPSGAADRFQQSNTASGFAGRSTTEISVKHMPVMTLRSAGSRAVTRPPIENPL